MADLENTDFDDILDHWCGKKRHGYRWEGETGVNNFEDLTKDIGYRQGIEEFLADNSGAIEVLLEWIADHAEKGGSEWKTNLAEACSYLSDMEEAEEDDPENDEDELDEDGFIPEEGLKSAGPPIPVRGRFMTDEEFNAENGPQVGEIIEDFSDDKPTTPETWEQQQEAEKIRSLGL